MSVVNPKDKKLRAIKLIQDTVLGGKSVKAAAKDMGISADTAERTLEWARAANLFVEYENRLYDELLPLAHDAIKLALQDGDAQVALKIMDNAGLGAQRFKQSKAQEESTEGLYGEIARLRLGNVLDVTPRGNQRRLGPGHRMEAIDTTGDSMDGVSGCIPESNFDGLAQTAAGESQTGQESSDPPTEDAAGL